MTRPANPLPPRSPAMRTVARGSMLLALVVGFALPTTALAQDAGVGTDLGTSTNGDPVNVEFNAGDVTPIGIDDCVTRTEGIIGLRLTENHGSNSVIDPSYRFYWHTSDSPCFIGTGLAGCPSANADGTCGCIDEISANSLSFRIADLGFEVLCGEGGPDTLYFAGQVVFADADGEDEIYDTERSVSVEFDRVRPGRPSAAPTVIGIENALKVRGESVEGADRYEVCARPYTGSDATYVETGSNDELRAPFSTLDCSTTSSLGNDGFRVTGLENNIAYEVVYAAVDAAGNRGPSSRSAVGTPVPQLDFAELYTNSLGGQVGEQGGCSTRPGLPTSTLPVLVVVGLAFALRRRRHLTDADTHGDHE